MGQYIADTFWLQKVQYRQKIGWLARFICQSITNNYNLYIIIKVIILLTIEKANRNCRNNKQSDLTLTHSLLLQSCPRPKLALNGVGGKSATELLRHLQ